MINIDRDVDPTIRHEYVATNLQTGVQIVSANLPRILKYLRNFVVIGKHGNKIRTILLENGVYQAYGYDRYEYKDHNGNIYYHRYEITVRRW